MILTGLIFIDKGMKFLTYLYLELGVICYLYFIL